MTAALELVNIVAADPVQILDMLDGLNGHAILLSDRGGSRSASWWPIGHWPVLKDLRFGRRISG